MQVMAVAGLAMSAISAVGQYKAGKAAQANYKSQANMAEFQGRSQAIAYKQQGVAALDGLVRSNASINAAAGAGLVQVNLTGSAATIKTANERFGVSNFQHRQAQCCDGDRNGRYAGEHLPGCRQVGRAGGSVWRHRDIGQRVHVVCC
jgi:hypothetical protein